RIVEVWAVAVENRTRVVIASKVRRIVRGLSSLSCEFWREFFFGDKTVDFCQPTRVKLSAKHGFDGGDGVTKLEGFCFSCCATRRINCVRQMSCEFARWGTKSRYGTAGRVTAGRNIESIAKERMH